MSIFTTIKEALLTGWVKRFLSKQNLTQASTWKGLIRIAVATGVFTLSPEAQDTLVTLVMQIIATGTLATGVIDAIRNERKQPAPLPWAETK